MADTKNEEPKEEVAQEEAEVTEVSTDVVAVDRPIPSGKHPLHRGWTMWYDAPEKNKRPAPGAKWGSNVKKIVSFRYVEDFWCLFNNLMAPTKLAEKSNYHLFVENVMPAWEDPKNANGGKWALQLNTSEREKAMLDDIWLWTILEMIGEGFEDSEEVCGVVVGLRKGRNRISLWTKTATDSGAQKRIGAHLKKKMALGPRNKLTYTAHADAYERGAKPLYEA